MVTRWAGYLVARSLRACFNRAMSPSVSPGRERIDSYLICATPRTGSSLLCGLLDSTGIAGHPESYFRRQDEREFAARWGIARTVQRHLSLRQLLPGGGRRPGARSTASSPPGSCGERWTRSPPISLPSTPAMLARLPGPAARCLSAGTRFVYLRRGDVVAQAVSLLRAEQTGVWFETAQRTPRTASGTGLRLRPGPRPGPPDRGPQHLVGREWFDCRPAYSPAWWALRGSRRRSRPRRPRGARLPRARPGRQPRDRRPAPATR